MAKRHVLKHAETLIELVKCSVHYFFAAPFNILLSELIFDVNKQVLLG